jgi:hypothetical protein
MNQAVQLQMLARQLSKTAAREEKLMRKILGGDND